MTARLPGFPAVSLPIAPQPRTSTVAISLGRPTGVSRMYALPANLPFLRLPGHGDGDVQRRGRRHEAAQVQPRSGAGHLAPGEPHRVDVPARLAELGRHCGRRGAGQVEDDGLIRRRIERRARRFDAQRRALHGRLVGFRRLACLHPFLPARLDAREHGRGRGRQGGRDGQHRGRGAVGGVEVGVRVAGETLGKRVIGRGNGSI